MCHSRNMGHARPLSKRNTSSFPVPIFLRRRYNQKGAGRLGVEVDLIATMATKVAAVENVDWIAYGELGLLAIALLLGLFRCRRTTLRAPCVWTLASVVTVGWVDFGSGSAAMRFLAAATTVCPLMAVLGAKRPQNGGWQWVVVTLWLVVAWPAVPAVAAIGMGDRFELFAVWKFFVAGLIGIGLLNYLPTRHWLAAILVAVGQLILFGEFLGGEVFGFNPWQLPIAAGSWLIAAASVLLKVATVGGHATANSKRNPSKKAKLSHIQQHWLNFRDAYGSFWALRILTRINHAAELRDWPMRLAWSGFVATEGEESFDLSAEQMAELEQTMSSLLRRFVEKEPQIDL